MKGWIGPACHNVGATGVDLGCPSLDRHEVIPTKRLWAAKPFLVAYVIAVGFTVGLLVNRAPTGGDAVEAIAGVPSATHSGAGTEREGREAPLVLQFFRPSQPTARLMLRTGLPLLTVADGTVVGAGQRNLLVFFWTGKTGEKPQTFFQIMLPFLRPSPQVVQDPEPFRTEPDSSGPATPPPTDNSKPLAGPGPAPDPKPAAVLGGGLPLVGIYHTHDWESYLSEFPGLTVKSEADLGKLASYDHKRRTVVDLGNILAVRLRDLGVATVHSRGSHQDLGYDFAYKSSRVTAKDILRKAPSTRILIDVHRDGVLGVTSRASVGGKRVAQVRCIIGQYEQPRWEKNKTFCEQLVTRLERDHPGITLPTRVQNDTYNQDLLTGAILLEIGNALDRYDEAERTLRYLAEALAALVRDGEYPR